MCHNGKRNLNQKRTFEQTGSNVNNKPVIYNEVLNTVNIIYYTILGNSNPK